MRINQPYLENHDGFKSVFLGGQESNYKINQSGLLISFNQGTWVIFRPMDGFPLVSLNRALGDGRTCKGFNWKYVD